MRCLRWPTFVQRGENGEEERSATFCPTERSREGQAGAGSGGGGQGTQVPRAHADESGRWRLAAAAQREAARQRCGADSSKAERMRRSRGK
jgi:hypothetical protein